MSPSRGAASLFEMDPDPAGKWTPVCRGLQAAELRAEEGTGRRDEKARGGALTLDVVAGERTPAKRPGSGLPQRAHDRREQRPDRISAAGVGERGKARPGLKENASDRDD